MPEYECKKDDELSEKESELSDTESVDSVPADTPWLDAWLKLVAPKFRTEMLTWVNETYQPAEQWLLAETRDAAWVADWAVSLRVKKLQDLPRAQQLACLVPPQAGRSQARRHLVRGVEEQVEKLLASKAPPFEAMSPRTARPVLDARPSGR